MGKGRAPCCDKSQVKRGPWSPSEDLRLIAFIQKQGHENWRALPKQAGLLRCGKSCRLRWINYLRPDVKRGNLTSEEEDTIIKLHEALGNKWSKIASFLPGRTDNEIKNMWNTHLKKKLVHKKSDFTGGHRANNESSPKQSSSTTSSCTSSSITSVSWDRSNVKAEEIEHYDSAVKTHCSESEMMIAGSSINTSNFVACENFNSTASNLKNHHHQQQIDGSSFELGGNYSETNNIIEALQEVNKPPGGLLEIPLESDVDFWDMFDGLDPFVTSNSQMNNLQVVGDHGDEYNKWFQCLEYELGLEGQNYNDYYL